MPRIQIEIARAEQATNPDPLVVEYLGEDFTCRNEFNQFIFMEMVATEVGDGTSVAELTMVMSAFMQFLQDIIVPEDWDRFRKVCRANRVSVGQLQPLIQGIAEYYSANPTPPSSDSSGGPTSTTTSSKVDNSTVEAAYQRS